MDESSNRVNGFIDSIYEQICLKAAPEQKKDQRTSTELVKLPDPPPVKIDVIINITPDETKSFRRVQQQKVEIVQEEQEVFERQEDLLQILANANQIIIDDDDSSSIFTKLLDKLKKEQIKDCVSYLQSFKYQDQKEKEQMKKIINILKNLKDHEFNLKDYSSEPFEEIKKELIKNISDSKNIMELLTFLVMLTSIDDQFIQFGSNSLHMLVMMKVDVRNQCFENIRIKNTSLIGGNFVRCDLNGSEFENVDISGVNFNGDQMFNCKWMNIKFHLKNYLHQENKNFNQIAIQYGFIQYASLQGYQQRIQWREMTRESSILNEYYY
ncbi:unnamed protein product [Paramecium pentaurelia]|uniref:Pentapeptide repeat-containing protein n=1 Tax=Paramecium pentaurelia TaxID=43138 RepID=A0A8S1VL89_9CILI|nr:unnamed protein product [Paramecium pentaurelia]